jgi:adenylate kinase family enzyme
MGVPFIELDGLFHRAGWTEPPVEEFRARVSAELEGDGWVVDGNYEAVQEGIWERADTVIWLDLPRPVIMRRVILRTLRRAVTRETLWNGNREPLTNFSRWSPEENIIRWAWTRYPEYRRRYGRAMVMAGQHPNITWVRLTSDLEVERFVRRTAENTSSGS